MSSGNEFLQKVAQELAQELRKRLVIPANTDAHPSDPHAASAKILVTLMVLFWIRLVEDDGKATIVQAKEAWTRLGRRSDFMEASGLHQNEAERAEAAAWDLFEHTPALAQAAVFKVHEKTYMIHRLGGTVTAQPFPAPEPPVMPHSPTNP